jgi:hypothetical protein
MNRLARVSASIVLAAAVLVAGSSCHRGAATATASAYVYVQQDRYIPALAGDLSAYRDRPILLDEFVNEVENTGTYYYYSPDGNVTYETEPWVEEYLRTSFGKAMTSVGMVVLLEPPPAAAPSLADLQVTLISWDDYAMRFQALLSRAGQAIYQQEYRVEVPRIETAETQILEDRAYGIMDMVVSGMLSDPGFQAAVLQ